MTTQEANRQVEACERQITSAYSNLQSAARSMGISAVDTASSKTTRNTLLSLIVSLIGLFVCFASHPVWGIILIIVGIIIAYNMHKSAKSTQTTIENQQRNLNSILDNNSRI